MIDYFIQLDQQLFLWIQQHCHNSFFDLVMPWMREKTNWVALYLLIIITLTVKYRWVGLRIILVAVICLMLSDAMSSHLAKPIFKRLRPCEDAVISQQFTPLVKCNNKGYSFTSSHAANHFAVALSLSLFFFPRKKWLLYAGIFWAGVISIAQVYVGVHYPLDIAAGAGIGISISILAHSIIQRYFGKYFILNNQPTNHGL
ncbi:MAG: phosphatase PAP2 family protein [Bacteroidetes bacterium]|nr:phosphatase PAP2 family protein [Bacteroidota bacterium]